MLGITFDHDTIRRYIIIFGTLFNEIYLNRDDGTGNKRSAKVPLTYSPKDKMLARLNSDPDLNRPVAMTLPRMAFEMVSLEYDPQRKLTSTGKFASGAFTANNQSHQYAYNPVPYNFYFNLYVMVKNARDGTAIAGQILPFFTPDFTVVSNIIDDLDIKMNVPIVLLDAQVEDLYEGDYSQRRSLIWTFSFVLRGDLFGPIRKQGLINKAIINFYTPPQEDIDDGIANSEIVATVTTIPGLTVDGTPTSNASISVALTEINRDDDYGFIVTFDEDG